MRSSYRSAKPIHPMVMSEIDMRAKWTRKHVPERNRCRDCRGTGIDPSKRKYTSLFLDSYNCDVCAGSGKRIQQTAADSSKVK